MMIYGIEDYSTKRRNKSIIKIIVVIIIAITISVLGAIKLVDYLNSRNVAKEDNLQNNKEQQSATSKENQHTENVEVQENKQTGNDGTQGNQQTKNTEIPKNVDQSDNENKETASSNQALTDEQIAKINQIYKQEEKTAFLTFDDGPSKAITPKILETLKQENIKATFFVLGTMVKSNPEVLKQAYEEGHYIANHGYSHVYKKIYANKNNALEEYKQTNELIQKALENSEYQSNVFRFPGGSTGGYYHDIKVEAKKVLKENHVAYLDWNALTNDADGADTEEKIMKNLKSTCKGKNSVVVLMHDAPNKGLTAETLPKVIHYLREQGYTFKNLYDIL